MKKAVVFVIIFCFACNKKQMNDECYEIKKKYDSILNLKREVNQIPFHKFYNILSRERGVPNDSILISEYESLKGKDSLIDLYIWDRIYTINQNITKNNVYKEFKGTYILKSNHNKKYAQIDKVIINKDSCYLYKYNELILKDKFKLINSSNKYIKGKLRLRNYRLRLDGTIKSKLLVHIDDNGCMDCEQLQFYKSSFN